MIHKSNCHDDIIFNFFNAVGKERSIYKHGKNIFYNGDRLYSFGTHYILAVKCRNGYLLNTNYYSNCTSRHQWNVWRHVVDAKVDFANVNLSLVESFISEEHFEDIRIIDKGKLPNIHDYDNDAVLIGLGGVKLLYGRDDSCRKWTGRGFIAKMPYHIKSVDDAVDKLFRGKDISHQCAMVGEVILTPCPEFGTRELKSKADEVLVPVAGISAIIDVNDSNINILQNFVELDRDGKYRGMNINKQTDVYWNKGKPYLVFYDGLHAGMRIPEDAVFMDDMPCLKVFTKVVKHHDFRCKNGITHKFHARDAIFLDNGRQMFVRGTVRCVMHDMVRLGDIWHKVDFWDSDKIKFEC